jgi:hypothetical protein
MQIYFVFREELKESPRIQQYDLALHTVNNCEQLCCIFVLLRCVAVRCVAVRCGVVWCGMVWFRYVSVFLFRFILFLFVFVLFCFSFVLFQFCFSFVSVLFHLSAALDGQTADSLSQR